MSQLNMGKNLVLEELSLNSQSWEVPTVALPREINVGAYSSVEQCKDVRIWAA